MSYNNQKLHWADKFREPRLLHRLNELVVDSMAAAPVTCSEPKTAGFDYTGAMSPSPPLYSQSSPRKSAILERGRRPRIMSSPLSQNPLLEIA